MILKFEFYFSSSLKTIAYFLEYWAKKSHMKYSLEITKNIVYLYVKADEKKLNKFSDEFLSMVPHFLFLQDTKVEVVSQMPEFVEQKYEFEFANLTPYFIKSSKNEFEFGADEVLASKIADEISLGNEVSYGGYILSKFSDFECDYLMPTNMKVIPKVFICDEKSMIALASFEKPVLSLKLGAVFRSNHANSPVFFDLRLAFEPTLYRAMAKLYEVGINFTKVKTTKNDLKIEVLDDSFLIIQNSRYLSKSDLGFIENKSDKNLAIFGLVLREFELLDKTVARVFLSKTRDDFIKIYKNDDEFDLLKIQIPSSYEEIYDTISSFDGGDKLLENYKKSFALPSGNINLPNNFYSIFLIADEILGFGGKIFDFAREFGGQKGVRIDFKMSSKTKFDIIRLVRSLMSFKLAGAEPKNISYGCMESLAFFLSDLGDILKDEFECENFLLSGSLFEHKTISNLVLKFSNSNYRTTFSKQYPLEIS